METTQRRKFSIEMIINIIYFVVTAVFRTEIYHSAIFTRLKARKGRKEESNCKYGVPRRPILTFSVILCGVQYFGYNTKAQYT